MIRNITTYLFLLLVPIFANGEEKIEFEGSAPRTVIEGNRFQLVYTVNKEASNLRVPDFEDFSVLMGPTTSQSQSVQIINNQVSRSVNYSYTYVLRADSPGKYTIPPATITVNGEQVESNEVTIEVVAGDDPAAQQQEGRSREESSTTTITDDDLFIRQTASKTNVYEDEPILLTTKIYTRVNLESISDIREPELRDFISENLESQSGSIEWDAENIDGKTYRTGILNQKVVYPQNSGEIRIAPVTIEFLVRQRQARRSQSIFGDFFDGYRTVRKRVNSNPLNINVRPLPSPRPQNFSGIVGNISLNVTASTTETTVNDGITIRAEISGRGNHNMARNPQFSFPQQFDVFDPSVTNNITQTRRGGEGSRIVETLIIPRHRGTYEIAPVEYSYFNPQTGNYATLTSDPITINVTGSETAVQDTAAPSRPSRTSSRERVTYLGEDIRYIQPSPGNLQPSSQFIFGTTLFYGGYIIPFILFILTYIVYRKKIKENADIQKVKTKRANRIARKKLKKSAKLLKQGDNEGFYEELAHALWGYTADKLSIPVADLNKDNVRHILIEKSVKEETANDFLNIIEVCEFARYSPKNDHEERDQLYKNALNNISLLENQLKK
ncbi:BatD family protein [Marinilabiliaceae bacterium ANBcel2]|nr:BatD family protein [Marinilabiliaceae bacterium ANBcel2]